jgi:uncharacterized membrane protein YkoI
MKKKVWIWIGSGAVLLIILLLLVTQIAKPIFSTATDLTEQEAQDVAEQRYSGTVKHIQQVANEFVIEIERDTGLYELKISSKTGEVSSLKRIKETVDSKPTEEETTEPTILLEEEIKTLVLQNANGKIHSISKLTEGERPIYQVEVREANIKKTLSIDAITGEILKTETVDIAASPKELTEQDAKALALEKVAGIVEDVDIETINGIAYYFVEVETTDGREATIEINAITGEVNSLTWDEDTDDDD